MVFWVFARVVVWAVAMVLWVVARAVDNMRIRITYSVPLQ